jgi:hypothetical protein
VQPRRRQEPRSVVSDRHAAGPAACCASGDATQGQCKSRAELEPALPAAQLARLRADTCVASEELCAPDAWLTGAARDTEDLSRGG